MTGSFFGFFSDRRRLWYEHHVGELLRCNSIGRSDKSDRLLPEL